MDDATRMAAAEYVLGTLPGDERARLAERIAREPDLAAEVAAIEARLAPLAAALPSEAPPADLWERISDRIGSEAAVPAAPAARFRTEDRERPSAEIISLRRSLAVWRGATMATTALAAALALAVIVRPDFFMPTGREEAAGTTDRYVAVVDTEGRQPAMIVTVDTDAGTVTVRSLAAHVPADHSLELWYVGGEGGSPRSIGILEEREDAKTLKVSASEFARIGEAAIAVSVEPPGGSPTGSATGPVIYQGKLIAEPK
ncbi:anti-sigma factor domain-containing protein [Afifella sp. IM 167]|uniref:anti-sigma factor n=1 Tax=Afifella sp. IM 167 TaxID=2033586 RepID=UPI001CD03953|nr:anti-sigma factor [Afifella sp. IM 167]